MSEKPAGNGQNPVMIAAISRVYAAGLTSSNSTSVDIRSRKAEKSVRDFLDFMAPPKDN